MNRREFVAALAGVAIAPRILEQLQQSTDSDSLARAAEETRDYLQRHDAYEVYYRFYDLELLRPDRSARIVNLTAQ